MGGRETPTFTFTLAIVGIGNAKNSASNNAPKNIFFIL
jgi:hypothetical protein